MGLDKQYAQDAADQAGQGEDRVGRISNSMIREGYVNLADIQYMGWPRPLKSEPVCSHDSENELRIGLNL